MSPACFHKRWFSLREAAKEGAQEWEVAGAGVAAMQVLFVVVVVVVVVVVFLEAKLFSGQHC